VAPDLTAVVMKSSLSSGKWVNDSVEQTRRLQLQGQETRVKQAASSDFLLCLFFDAEDVRRPVPPKRRLTSDGLQGTYPRQI
jgi:hypothetical protein